MKSSDVPQKPVGNVFNIIKAYLIGGDADGISGTHSDSVASARKGSSDLRRSTESLGEVVILDAILATHN